MSEERLVYALSRVWDVCGCSGREENTNTAVTRKYEDRNQTSTVMKYNSWGHKKISQKIPKRCSRSMCSYSWSDPIVNSILDLDRCTGL